MTRVAPLITAPDPNEWRTYDEFAAGINTYRLPNVSLAGTHLSIQCDNDTTISLTFSEGAVEWTSSGGINSNGLQTDPYDAVRVREDVLFVNLPLESQEREALTIIYSETSHRALVTHSHIAETAVEGEPQVGQTFYAGITDQGDPTGEVPAPSRDLIGKRNLYRYSPQHLYEHVYLSSQRYAWQCVQGVQRGHGDVDMSTVWKFDEGLYLFCFREFRIPVASVWLHDLSYQLMTTGIFLGINGENQAEHSTAGGHIYPGGGLSYPDVEPV